MAQRPSSTPPSSLSTLVLFFALCAAILLGHNWVVSRFFPPAAPVAEAEKEKQPEKAKPTEATKTAEPGKAAAASKPQPKDAKPPTKPEAEKPKPAAKPAAPAQVQRQWVTLGSADENDPYRMLVTLDNQGAALARTELSADRYRELQDRTGYLGHVVMEDDGKEGAPVQVVGAGTPAARAGLKPGDRIKAVILSGNRGELAVKDAAGLDAALARTKPDDEVELVVVRGGKPLDQSLMAKLSSRPLEVIRPERKEPQPLSTDPRPFDAIHSDKNSPLSMLTTLAQIGEGEKAQKLDDDVDSLDAELDGVDLRKANWRIVSHDQDHAEFSCTTLDGKLAVTKSYRLAPVPPDQLADADYRAYHLVFSIKIENIDPKKETQVVAYRQDGPNGLPDEGAWYTSKVAHEGVFRGSGLRDVVAQRRNTNVYDRTAVEIADKGIMRFDDQSERPFVYLGVDAQYFTAELLPASKDREEENVPQIDRAVAMRVGDVDPQRKNITNTSFRITGKTRELKAGESFTDEYQLFAGPKKPDLLKQYGLGDVVTYGWYGWVARPMTWVLHFFFGIVRNYGIAIILLTVVVRLCMFPLSRKQALGAQKMQQLQPEMKKLQEKYKKDPEGRMKAQQELFRKHDYNPLAGCLPLFIQLPIFVGLYRSLQVDVELRGAALISHAVRWCSNLAAPDMLFDWSGFMPDFVNRGVGFFGLGPYFNLLPLLTIGLFIAQQKMFMPPPADEQAAMQQKVMNFMMIFMGLLFFKVAAGLCIYFIASSLWGMAERKFLPKMAKAAGETEGNGGTSRFARRPASPDRDGAGTRKKKSRKK